MAKSDKNTLTTASVLAFERKLDPSDALFYAGRWERRDQSDTWRPVGVREKSVRGTISNRQKKGDIDPAKLDAAIENPNLQTVDVATLPADADTLKVRFTLRVLGGAGVPSACNNPSYQQKLRGFVRGYVSEHGYRELALRYACNLANARFLWRNRLSAESIEVRIAQLQSGSIARSWLFNALHFSLRGFDIPREHVGALQELASVIADGLAGEGYALLEVVAFARMGDGQETFPSQELILDKGADRAGKKSKTLYTVAEVASVHSQKLGNAIRTIDNWYPDADIDLGPIAVEPYGSVTSLGKAYRQPREGADFYSLLDGWMIKDKPLTKDEQHYVMATLIRGGVFGASGKE